MAYALTPLPLPATMLNHAPTNGASTTHSANGSCAPDLWTRYENLKDVDGSKNALIEDVLTRYDSVVRQCQDLINQQVVQHHQSDPPGFYEREKKYQEGFAHLQYLPDREPFITVIVDGNSMLFNDSYLRDGERGGRQAAVVLKDEIAEWVPNNLPSPPAKFRLNVKVYADFRMLATTLLKAGIFDNLSKFGDFTRGFNSLFDFVDIGSGNVNNKIIENLKLCLYVYNCHQVLVGGAREMLESFNGDKEAQQRVTLLQTISSSAKYPFKTACFQEVFRATRLNTSIDNMTPRTGTPGSLSGVSASGISNGYLSGLSIHDRTNSIASSVTSLDQPSGPSGKPSWAKLAQSVAPLPLTSIVPRAIEGPAPLHNKKGQRIDPPFDGDYDGLARVKKIKMCNMHYLHQDGCKWPADKCNHRHDYKPTPVEIKLLRSVSRETACRHGVTCDETLCVYGHRCPYPVAKDGSMRGLGCMKGDNCRFPREMHGIKDSAPARGSKC